MNKEKEVPLHRKKKESNTSKAKVKSKHQHKYVDCLFIQNNIPRKGTYCQFCGKIGEMKVFETEKIDKGLYHQLTNDEVFEKYKNLERIEIDDTFQKFIPIADKCF